MDAEPFSRRVIGRAIEVHRTLGPGLLEPVHEACLCQEPADARLNLTRQAKLPVIYKGQPIDRDLRMDIAVEDALVIEVRAVQAINPIHEAQLLTYPRLSGVRTGLLLNFNEIRLTDGIRRRLH